jgi:hypothetical protein
MGHHRVRVRQCGRFYAPSKVHQKKEETISAGSRRFPDRLGDMQVTILGVVSSEGSIHCTLKTYLAFDLSLSK